MGIGNHRIVTETVDYGECGEKDTDFEVIHYPSTPDRGMSGPWEDSEEGEPSSVEIMGAKIGDRDVFWMFDAEALRLIAESIREELDSEQFEFDVPDYDDRMAA